MDVNNNAWYFTGEIDYKKIPLIQKCKNIIVKCSVTTNFEVDNIISYLHNICSSGEMKTLDLREFYLPSGIYSIGYCSNIEKIILPQGESRISYCKNLKEIVLPQNSLLNITETNHNISLTKFVVEYGHKYYCVKNDALYSKDGRTLLLFPTNKICNYKLEESTEFIHENAFEGSLLKSISLNRNLKNIGKHAFKNSRIEKLYFNQSECELDEFVFEGCSRLHDIMIPAYWKTIKKGTFSKCTNLKDVKLSDNLKRIGTENDHYSGNSFEGCQNLASIDIPASVSWINSFSFKNCANLKTVTFHEGLQVIGGKSFQGCSSLVSVSIPKSVTSIGDESFEYCSSLNEMNLSQEGTPEINSSAFAYSGLRSITIPETVTAVGGGILNGCSRLTSIFWECNRDVPNIIDLNSTSCLLYLSHDVKCPSTWKNVIEPGGVAQTIVLKNEKRYLCPKAFTANKISYTREFAMKTIPGKAAGWQTIILPFSVQTITDKDGNRLAPFMAEGDGIWKRFWLRELQADGTYKDVTAIEANKPYLIAMPNAEEYASEYCISGNVTFEADNVSLGETPEIVPTDGGAYSMYGTYDWVTGTRKVYALNLDNWWDGSVYYEKGSVFVPSLRDVAPFECYLQNNNPSASTRGFIGIVGSHASTRAGHPLGSKPSVTDM